MTPWHILWVTERFPPLGGGMAESASRQVRGLRLRDHRVEVVHFTQRDGPLVVRRRARDNGDDLSVLCGEVSGNAVQRAWREVELDHRRRRFDVAVGFGSGFPGHVATTWAAWLGVPSVVLVRGNDFDRDWFDARRHGLVASALSRATAVGTVSQEKAARIRALFPGTTTQWTPNSVDADRWDLLPGEETKRNSIRSDLGAPERRVFGVFGELKYKKRVPFWLEAVRDAGLKDHIGLLIVGRMDRELDELLEDPVLAPKSVHLSFRTPEQLPPLYHACDFLVLPSLFEGFPNVLLEAMACGVIPVCSRAGAMGEVLQDGETAFLFDVEDREGAARATRRALEMDPSAWIEMKNRVRATVREQFGPKREIDELERLLKTATEASGHDHKK